MDVTQSPEEVFVGREEQLRQMKKALQRTIEDHGRMIMLAGEPGIGKTRTAEEFAAQAAREGVLSVWGRCLEGQQTPPYWPWVQAIKAYMRAGGESKLREELSGKAPVLSEIIDDVHELFSDLHPPPPTIDPESAQFRLLDALAYFLKRASRSQALIFFLDDLHWADAPSLVFLRFLARELGDSNLLIIGMYRDVEINRKHPLQQTLADLAREQLYERLSLRGLEKKDVESFLRHAMPTGDTTKLATEVYAATEGNPLFVTEYTRHIASEGVRWIGNSGAAAGIGEVVPIYRPVTAACLGLPRL